MANMAEYHAGREWKRDLRQPGDQWRGLRSQEQGHQQHLTFGLPQVWQDSTRRQAPQDAVEVKAWCEHNGWQVDAEKGDHLECEISIDLDDETRSYEIKSTVRQD